MTDPEAVPPKEDDNRSMLEQLGFRTLAAQDYWFRHWKRMHGFDETAPQRLRAEPAIPQQGKLRRWLMRNIVYGESMYDSRETDIETEYAHIVLDKRHRRQLCSNEPFYVAHITVVPQLHDHQD